MRNVYANLLLFYFNRLEPLIESADFFFLLLFVILCSENSRVSIIQSFNSYWPIVASRLIILVFFSRKANTNWVWIGIEINLMINSYLFIGSVIVTTSKPVLNQRYVNAEIGAKWSSSRLNWLYYCVIAWLYAEVYYHISELHSLNYFIAVMPYWKSWFKSSTVVWWSS